MTVRLPVLTGTNQDRFLPRMRGMFAAVEATMVAAVAREGPHSWSIAQSLYRLCRRREVSSTVGQTGPVVRI